MAQPAGPSKKKQKLALKIDYMDLCEEITQPFPSASKINAILKAFQDDPKLNVEYLRKNPIVIERIVSTIPKLERMGVVHSLLVLLYDIWTNCPGLPTKIFDLDGRKGIRTVLIYLLTESKFREDVIMRIAALKCLSEVLLLDYAIGPRNNDKFIALFANLIDTHRSYRADPNEKRTAAAAKHVSISKVTSSTLVHICARANADLLSRITLEFGEDIAFLAKVGITHECAITARNCCLIWHNLCYDNIENASVLNRTRSVLDTAIGILTKFPGKGDGAPLARSAALLFIADMCALHVKMEDNINNEFRMAAKDILKLMFTVLVQDYRKMGSLPVLACCKALARLTSSDDSCRAELTGLLLGNLIQPHNDLLLMSVLLRWHPYENIVTYLLEICDNISFYNLLRVHEINQHTLKEYKDLLESLIYRFGIRNYQLGYAARRLLLGIEGRMLPSGYKSGS